MTAFDSDLTIDLQAIAKHDGVPFLHWTRKCGTDLALLHAADSEQFPPNGRRVPYLFGTCDRDQLAHKPVEQAEYWQAHETELVLYFDGQTIRKLSVSQAVDVAQGYYRKVIRAWRPKVGMGEMCVYA